MKAADRKHLAEIRAEQLADAIQQEKMPNVCAFGHPEAVFYDGKKCPCCQLLKENQQILRKVIDG